MIIKSVTLENFGLYHGVHTITFDVVKEQAITLIGGLNGRGKTTFLDAITLALYGRRALKYLQDERIRYSQYLVNHVNKSVAHDAECGVSLIMQESPTDQEEVAIRRFWSIAQKGEIGDSFVASRNGVVDSYLSENWDYYVEEILPLNISRFFFFDNEKIAQIADDDSFESVKESIHALLGLTTIDQLIIDMRKLSKRSINNALPAEKSEFIQLAAETYAQIDACEAEAKESQKIAGHSRQVILRAQSEYRKAEEQFWTQGGNLGLQRDQVKSERQALIERRAMNEERVRNYLANSVTPLFVCRSLVLRTYEQVEESERRKTMKYSKSVINMLKHLLSEEAHSQAFTRDAEIFLDNAEKILRDSVGPSDEGYGLSTMSNTLLKTFVEHGGDTLVEIRRLLADNKRIDEKMAQLDIHLSFEVNQNEARALWNKMQGLSTEIIQQESQLQIEEERSNSLEKKIDMLRNRYNRYLEKGRLFDQSQDESIRIAQYAVMTVEVMDAFKKRIQVKRVMGLENKIHECFSFMIQKESIIRRIDIDPDTLDIRLIDYTGGELLKTQLSAGEKQLLAVSILWGLAQSSGYDMPVIVDTPLGRLDSQHRTNFVERYLPHASKQVIVLSTDEEINGRYFTLIRPYVNAVYTLVYDDESKSTSISGGYFGGKSI